MLNLHAAFSLTKNLLIWFHAVPQIRIDVIGYLTP